MRKSSKLVTSLLACLLAGTTLISASAISAPRISENVPVKHLAATSSWNNAENAFKLDTLSYTMAPGNLYDFKVTLKGNLTQNDVKVTDSRNGSVVKLSRISGTDKYRIKAVKEGTAYIVAKVGNAHLSFTVEVKKGVKQSGKASHSNYAVASQPTITPIVEKNGSTQLKLAVRANGGKFSKESAKNPTLDTFILAGSQFSVMDMNRSQTYATYTLSDKDLIEDEGNNVTDDLLVTVPEWKEGSKYLVVFTKLPASYVAGQTVEIAYEKYVYYGDEEKMVDLKEGVNGLTSFIPLNINLVEKQMRVRVNDAKNVAVPNADVQIVFSDSANKQLSTQKGTTDRVGNAYFIYPQNVANCSVTVTNLVNGAKVLHTDNFPFKGQVWNNDMLTHTFKVNN